MIVLDEGLHASLVDTWLKRVAKDEPPEVLLKLFETAFSVLWSWTRTTLGEVTLNAIADRVLYNASEKFPALGLLKLESTGTFEDRELRERIGSLRDSELKEGFRFVLVEFLTVLGNLTAEILTPELHSKLAGITLPKTVRVEKRALHNPTDPKGTAGEDSGS